MPDQSKLAEILCRMQSDYIPEHIAAADDFLEEGFPPAVLLTIIQQVQQPNLVSMFFYISGKYSDTETLIAWNYLYQRFESNPKEFVTYSFDPWELSRENSYLLFAARKYLLTEKKMGIFHIYIEEIKSKAAPFMKNTAVQNFAGLGSPPIVIYYQWLHNFFAKYTPKGTQNKSTKQNSQRKRSYNVKCNSDETEEATNRDVKYYEAIMLHQLNKDALFDIGSKREKDAYMALKVLLRRGSNLAYAFVREIIADNRLSQLNPPLENYWNRCLYLFLDSLRITYNMENWPFEIGNEWENICRDICHMCYTDVLSSNQGTRLVNNSIPDITIGSLSRNDMGRIVHVSKIVECKKSLYFNGRFDALNNETTDKYINYCDMLEFWVLEKSSGFIEPDHPKVKYIFSQDLLNATWLPEKFKHRIQTLLQVIEVYKQAHTASTTDELCSVIDQILKYPLPQPKKKKQKKTVQPAFTIRQYNLDGTFLKEYDSIKNAAIATKLNTDTITNVTSGRRNSAGGFLWKKCPIGAPIKNIEPPNTALDLEGKVIFQVDQNGEIISSYETIGQAARLSGISRRSISDALKGIQKTAGGFTWALGKKV